MFDMPSRRWRNVVTLSHIDPAMHQWIKDEALRRSAKTGTRVTMTEIIGEAFDQYRARCDSEEAPVGAGEKVGQPASPVAALE